MINLECRHPKLDADILKNNEILLFPWKSTEYDQIPAFWHSVTQQTQQFLYTSNTFMGTRDKENK